jgi:hypothetical protein
MVSQGKWLPQKRPAMQDTSMPLFLSGQPERRCLRIICDVLICFFQTRICDSSSELCLVSGMSFIVPSPSFLFRSSRVAATHMIGVASIPCHSYNTTSGMMLFKNKDSYLQKGSITFIAVLKGNSQFGYQSWMIFARLRLTE